MGKVNAPAVGTAAQELQIDNPDARAVDCVIFADALRTYVEANENVRRNGAIVAHPRTGAPLENPYLKVRENAARALAKNSQMISDRVMQLLQAGALASDTVNSNEGNS